MTDQDWADDVSAYPQGHTVVVGCGNLLRGDDGVGPILIRHLWDDGVFDGRDDVVLVDGGTAGMDVGFKLRAAKHAILIDAAATGAEAGTIYEVPGEELAELPPLHGLHSHQFRWDHALAFGTWLLGDDYPEKVTVYLIEAADMTPGAALSGPVEAGLQIVKDRIVAIVGQGPEPLAEEVHVDFTDDGYLRISAAVAQRYFPSDALIPVSKSDELWLVPLHGPESGGLLLKQRNVHNDRSTLIHEYFDPAHLPSGRREAIWDENEGALRVALAIA